MEGPKPNELAKLPFEESEEGMAYIYANIINYNWTLTDVRLRFAELVHVTNPEDPTWDSQYKTIMEKVSVTIPWYQAKELRNMLDRLVRGYEEKNGEIKTPSLSDPASERKL